jgi:hypothetical protein
MPRELSPYLKVFGLKPGVSFRRITARYYARLEELSAEESPDRKATEQRLQHTYEILKRAYKSATPGAPPIRKRRTDATQPAAVAAAVTIALLLAVGAGVLLVMHRSDLKVKLTSYEAGEVVRWKEASDPYGKVMQFDPVHRFETGRPSPAYEIQLAGGTETVWVSERVVEKAMVAVQPR